MKEEIYILYKLTRNDGLIYIGTTCRSRFKIRMREHRMHKRFKSYSFHYTIVLESKNYDFIQDQEPIFIKLYNSFKCGLNESINGKGNHLCPRFTTKGFKYSEASKLLMGKLRREKFKTGELVAWNKGKKNCFSAETLERLRVANLGKRRFSKLTKQEVESILHLYFEVRPSFDIVGKVMRNGRPMSYDVAFSKCYADDFNVCPNNIKRIIRGECWKDVYKKYKV